MGEKSRFQKFLFYKYFYNNSKPLIITEGKIDILYIKAALKKLYKKYPELIRKIDDNKFEYNITFLNLLTRLSYFFGINTDGADTMKKIYNYYVNKEMIFPNYYDYFFAIRGV